MSRELKVYGGRYYISSPRRRAVAHRQFQRAIVAANTKKEAARVADISLNELRNYWCITGNETEVAIATAKPGVLFVQIGIDKYEEHTP